MSFFSHTNWRLRQWGKIVILPPLQPIFIYRVLVLSFIYSNMSSSLLVVFLIFSPSMFPVSITFGKPSFPIMLSNIPLSLYDCWLQFIVSFYSSWNVPIFCMLCPRYSRHSSLQIFIYEEIAQQSLLYRRLDITSLFSTHIFVCFLFLRIFLDPWILPQFLKSIFCYSYAPCHSAVYNYTTQILTFLHLLHFDVPTL